MSNEIEARRIQWRMLTVGSTCWAPRHGWAPATVVGLGKNRGNNTIVTIAFDTGGQGKRIVSELWWRKPELKGQDKPSTQETA